MAPSILLTNPTSTNSDPNVRLFIDTEKSLSYAPDLGWNWHKSWNLPNISIRLEVKIEIYSDQRLSHRGAATNSEKHLRKMIFLFRLKYSPLKKMVTIRDHKRLLFLMLELEGKVKWKWLMAKSTLAQ